jgi:hypothetical protein
MIPDAMRFRVYKGKFNGGGTDVDSKKLDLSQMGNLSAEDLLRRAHVPADS